MKLHRFIGELDLTRGNVRVADREVIYQIKDVLRLRSGDIVILADGKGREAEVRLGEIMKDIIQSENLYLSCLIEFAKSL